MDVPSLLRDPLVSAIGLTIVHFAWQGLLIAVLLSVFQRLGRRGGPNFQYTAGCVALLLMSICPAITLLILRPLVAASHSAPVPNALSVTLSASPLDRIEPYLPGLVVVWLLGVALGCTRLFLGWRSVQRLRHRDTAPAPRVLCDRLDQLKLRLGIGRAVDLLVSIHVEVPSAIGWLRPIVLLPAAAVTGLPFELLEALIAHELAHIRRHDYLVNLLQSVVEAVLFYHPAVWWVSHQIRMTRELCCDDVAVGLLADPMRYATALATMEEMRTMKESMALAGNGGVLLARIRRVLGLPEPASNGITIWLVGSVLAWVLLVTLPGRAGSQSTPPEPPSEKSAGRPSVESYRPEQVLARPGTPPRSSGWSPVERTVKVPPRLSSHVPSRGMPLVSGRPAVKVPTVSSPVAHAPAKLVGVWPGTLGISVQQTPTSDAFAEAPNRPLTDAEIRAMTARFEQILRARNNLARQEQKLAEKARQLDEDIFRTSPSPGRSGGALRERGKSDVYYGRTVIVTGPAGPVEVTDTRPEKGTEHSSGTSPVPVPLTGAAPNRRASTGPVGATISTSRVPTSTTPPPAVTPAMKAEVR